MNNSDHKGNQDVDPLKPIGPEGLPKKIWNRLSGRSKLPRWLWFPSKRHLDLDADGWQRQHDEVSKLREADLGEAEELTTKNGQKIPKKSNTT